MKDFRTLMVWKKSHELTLAIYQTTNGFPGSKLYGLTSQIRRASASIPANIAEGCGRSGDSDFARFLQIAMGSACELEYHILLAHDLGYIPLLEYEDLMVRVSEVKRMLSSFITRLRGEIRSSQQTLTAEN